MKKKYKPSNWIKKFTKDGNRSTTNLHDEEFQKFYQSARWLKVRKYKLKLNPLCEECEKNNIITIADCVDHITPIIELKDKQYDDKAIDIDNLQSLCNSCHIKKTIQEKIVRKKRIEEELIELNMKELNDFD